MARPKKYGLTYFPLDVDFFVDEKITSIRKEFGMKGEIVALRLLCAIYRQGYFAVWNEALQAKLTEEMQTVSLELLEAIVGRLVKLELFDKTLFDSQVLTSKGIQARYFEICKRRVFPNELPYLLVNPERTEKVLYTPSESLCNRNSELMLQKLGVNVAETHNPPDSQAIEGDEELMLQKLGVNVTETPNGGKNQRVTKTQKMSTNNNNKRKVNEIKENEIKPLTITTIEASENFSYGAQGAVAAPWLPLPPMPEIVEVGKGTFEQFLDEYFSLQQRGVVEQLCMNLRITPEQFRQLAGEAIIEWRQNRTKHATFTEAAKHLLNHVRLKLRIKSTEEQRAMQQGGRVARDSRRRQMMESAASELLNAINGTTETQIDERDETNKQP